MDYEPSLREVRDLIDDFAQDFGVTLALEDAERILTLYGELCVLFEQYSNDDGPILPYSVLER